MAKPRFGRKRGPVGSKSNESTKYKRPRRNKQIEDDKFPNDDSSSPSDSGDLSEEQSDNALEEEQEEVAIHKEPSMYDNLLKTLGSANDSIADAYKRRKRGEEGKSDEDENEKNDMRTLGDSDEDDDESESGSESGDLDPSDIQGASLATLGEPNEEEEEDDDDDVDETSYMNGDEALTENNHSVSIEIENSSSFTTHLNYELSKEEIDM